MKRIVMLTKPVVVFGLLCVCAAGVETAQAVDANLNMVFTTTDAGGSYGDRHVHVVWLETAAGQFVCTVGSSSSSTARAVWANSRASSLRTWWDANPERSQDVDARTGATQTAYRTYTIDWDWRTRDGAAVPDGTYRLRFLCTNADSGTPNNSAIFSNVTKGNSPWSVGPTSTGGYNNVRLTFTPATLGVSNGAATDVTEGTATLNGSVDGTGGSNPSVFIYWGDEDRGTEAAAWDHEISLGTLGAGPFSADVAGLTPGTRYYFRCYVNNGATSAWAAATASFKAVSTTVIFEEGDTWRYFKGYSTPAGWNTRDFDASEWLSGESGFGYGDGDDNTELTDMRNHYWSVYLRFEFVVDEPAEVEKLTFTVDYDDGFAAYINGGAVARQNLAEGAVYNTPASSHEAGAPVALDLTSHRSKLAAGRNVFAIEVHNTTLDSSDLSMIPELTMVGGMRPPQGDIALSAAVLDFGKVGVGQSADLSFDIANTGNAGLQVQSIGLVGLDKGSYSMAAEPTLPATLSPGGAATVTVRFSPGGAQDYRYAQVVVGSDDPDEPAAGVNLHGAGGPDAAVALNAIGGVGGPCRAVAALAPSRVVAGQGAVLAVLEQDGGGEFDILGQVRLAGNIVDIAVSGNAAYAALGASGVAVVDLGDPSRPIVVGRLPSLGHTYGVAAAGTHLCAAEGAGGVSRYDISNSLAPAAAAVYATEGPATAVAVGAAYAYVLDEQAGLSVFDLASSSAALGVCPVEFGRAVAVSGGRAYVADRLGDLFAVNVSNPAAPAVVVELRLAAAGRAIAVSGSQMFVASDAGIEVLNLGNPDAPESTGIIGVAGELADLAANGSEVYIAAGNEGLRLWDLPGVATATELAAYALQTAPQGVAANGSLGEVLAADGLGTASLDVSAIREAAVLWASGPAQGQDAAIAGNLFFVAAGASGLQIFERMDADSVEPRGAFATDGYACSVAVSGSVAAVADGIGVYVLDVNSPSSPALLGRWASDGWAGGVAVDSSYVYAANGDRGVAVLSLTDAALVRAVETGGVAHGVAVANGKAYVANGMRGLAVYDVLPLPAAPVRLGSFDTPGIATDVAIVGGRACVADGAGGVSVVDVSTAEQPVLYARGSDLVRSLATAESQSRLLVADDLGGLAILAAQAWPGSPFGDLDGDHAVLLADLINLAGNWLENEALLNVLIGNLNDDTAVNLADFAVLAGNWMAEYTD